MICTSEKTKEDSPIRGFLEEALADEAVADEVADAVFTNVVLGDRDAAALAEQLPGCVCRALDAATAADWEELAAGLITDAEQMEAEAGVDRGPRPVLANPAAREAESRGRTLRFIEHHRQRYATRVPIAEDGEFLIGAYRDDGTVDEAGEFSVALVGLTSGRRWALHPRVQAFGDGRGAFRQAIEAGLLDTLGPVARGEEFARRLLAIGISDGSDEPLVA